MDHKRIKEGFRGGSRMLKCKSRNDQYWVKQYKLFKILEKEVYFALLIESV